MGKNVDVSIIMINYKNANMTIDAVNSINSKSQKFNYEIIVVDNSNDIQEFNKLKNLINNEAICINANANLGFGNGNNLGSKYANGKYLYFINNDTLLINNAIYELYKFMEENSNCGIAGSNLYTTDNKPNHSFSKNEMTIREVKKQNSVFEIIKRNLFKRKDFNFTNNPIKLKGYVCGASLMISKDNFDKIGGFDKDIFMYAEETLLNYRVLHNLKLDIYNIPSSKIIHYEGASFGKDKIVTKFHAQSFVNGNYIYYLKAYSNEYAQKYLKCAIKIYSKKLKLAKITKKRNPESYVNLVEAFNNKLDAVRKEVF